MAQGINIGIASETKGFKRGIDTGVIAPLEDAAEAMERLGKDGDNAAEKIEDGLRDAQRETKELKDDFKALGREIENESRDASRNIKKNFQDSAQSGSANMRELGDEAKQNLAETLASFDGSGEGTIAGIQGTLGGVTAGLTGVIPVIAAAAGAAGLGLIAVAFQTQSEEAQKVREKVAELAADYIETGEIGEASVGFIVDRLKALALSTEEGGDTLAKLQKQAQGAASGFDKIAQAYAGNVEGIEELIAAEEEQLSIATRASQAGRQFASEAYNVNEQKIDGQRRIVQGLKEAQKVAEDAALAEAAYAASGAAELEAKAGLIESIDEAYDGAAGSVDNYINKESGLFDTSAYIAAMQEKEQALRDYQETLTSSELSSEAVSFLNDQGQETAALLLQGYKSASASQKAELERIWTEAGSSSSGAFNSELNSGLKANTPPTQKVKVTADMSEFEKSLNRSRNVFVDIVANVRNGRGTN